MGWGGLTSNSLPLCLRIVVPGAATYWIGALGLRAAEATLKTSCWRRHEEAVRHGHAGNTGQVGGQQCVFERGRRGCEGCRAGAVELDQARRRSRQPRLQLESAGKGAGPRGGGKGQLLDVVAAARNWKTWPARADCTARLRVFGTRRERRVAAGIDAIGDDQLRRRRSPRNRPASPVFPAPPFDVTGERDVELGRTQRAIRAGHRLGRDKRRRRRVDRAVVATGSV